MGVAPDTFRRCVEKMGAGATATHLYLSLGGEASKIKELCNRIQDWRKAKSFGLGSHGYVALAVPVLLTMLQTRSRDCHLRDRRACPAAEGGDPPSLIRQGHQAYRLRPSHSSAAVQNEPAHGAAQRCSSYPIHVRVLLLTGLR